MINKEFVPYKEALELKQLGFDEPCFGWYDGRYKTSINRDYCKNSEEWLNTIHCAAPTFSQAFRWFREKHELVGIVRFGTNDFTFNIYNSDAFGLLTKESLDFNGTYEEAELACLRKLIEIEKEKENG